MALAVESDLNPGSKHRKDDAIPCIFKFLPAAFLIAFACQPSVSDDELAIRAARADSNAALANHDTTALAMTLTEDYHVVTSRNAVSVNRSSMLARLAADWSSKPDLIYLRSTSAIEVFGQWQMAGENGTWEGTWTEANGDRIKLTGNYYAKWHKVHGAWLIRAEIFTALKCEGGHYCDKGPLAGD